MGLYKHIIYDEAVVWFLLGALILSQACIVSADYQGQPRNYGRATLYVNASSTYQIPPNFFGIFFEEINHAGAGGLWAELVRNRGFEAGGRHEPSMITPWGMIGDETTIYITTELSSCFKNNPVALRMDVYCNPNCPPGGVGVYNPGYWGMNIEAGKSYRVVFYVRSSGPLDAMLSFVDHTDGIYVVAFQQITAETEAVKDWTKMEVVLKATGSNPKCRLQLTTTQNGTIWLDQVSAMPVETYMSHGFRIDLMDMLLKLKPRFLRFPGGCYVEGMWLSNAFRWKETVGPWEERPGHLGDVWGYWSDDGLGYLEYLQLAEDLGAEAVWVFNSGQSTYKDEIATPLIGPFVQEMLDSIEFARGSPNSSWGSFRAYLGHPEPFNLSYVAIGNENCGQMTYKGNYLKFYYALKQAYPDIKVISNCDGSKGPLDHPADLYDYHNYTSAKGMLELTHLFQKTPRQPLGTPKAAVAFVSEYAVTDPMDKVENGTFGAALAEAAFLLSLEKNSDVVAMVSYAPLFVNENDRRWLPDAIFFNSDQLYGTPSYWVQTFFTQSSGAFRLHSYLKTQSTRIFASAISWWDDIQKRDHITIKFVNYQKMKVKLSIDIQGIDPKLIQPATQTILTADDLYARNTLDYPNKVVPQIGPIQAWASGNYIVVEVQPYSFTAFDFIRLLNQG